MGTKIYKAKDQDKNKMVNPRLVEYIRHYSKGYSTDQIIAGLRQQGYGAKDINDAKEFISEEAKQVQRIIHPIKHRNPFMVFVLTFVTLGIYGLYWLYSTANELENGPSPRLVFALIIPIINFFVLFYFLWKYSKAINEKTGFSDIGLFLLWIFLGPVAMVISQIELNQMA